MPCRKNPSYGDPHVTSPRSVLRDGTPCSFGGRLGLAMRRHQWAIEKVYGVTLTPVPRLSHCCSDALRQAKIWLETQSVCFGRCGRRERWGGRMAMKLGKKLIPEPCRHVTSGMKSEWVRNQTDPTSGDLPHSLLRHAARVVDKIFEPRWDVFSYASSIAGSNVSSASCKEKSRDQGGSRNHISDERYLDLVSGELDFPDSAFEFKYSEVATAGKVRPLTIPSADLNALRPLHKLVYTKLCRQRWLLKGEPTPDKILRAGFRFKHGILSGDYQSATDNLDLRLSFYLLKRILDRAVVVPRRVRSAALRSLFPRVTVDGITYQVCKGQMMGSLLSFPLLCLYNYVVSSYALGPVPMLINGDDIIAETSKPERWFEALPPLGLIPEKSKTSYRMSAFEINSTVFLVKDSVPVACPILRTRSLVKVPETPSGFGSRLRSFAKDCATVARCFKQAKVVFLAAFGDVLSKALHAGLSPTLFDLRDDARLPCAEPYVVLAAKCAKANVRLSNPPAASTLESQPRALRRCHGTLDHDQAYTERCYSFLSCFGLPRTLGTYRDARCWWSEVSERWVANPVVSELPMAVVFSSFAIKLVAGAERVPRLYNGEPCTQRVWFAREFPMEVARPCRMVDARLRLPSSTWTGYSTLKWHAGARMEGSGVMELS